MGNLRLPLTLIIMNVPASNPSSIAGSLKAYYAISYSLLCDNCFILTKKHRIVGSHADKAPGKKDLLKAIIEITDYYSRTYHFGEDHPKFNWIDWESIELLFHFLTQLH